MPEKTDQDPKAVLRALMLTLITTILAPLLAACNRTESGCLISR